MFSVPANFRRVVVFFALCGAAGVLLACGQKPAPPATTTPTPAPTTVATITATATLPPRPALPALHPVLPPLPSPTPTQSVEPTPERPPTLFMAAARRASVDASSAVIALGPGASAALDLLNQLTAPEEPARLFAALEWCARHDWPEAATTVTLVKNALPANESNRALVQRLAAAEEFAWPAPLDANTMLPNFVNMQTIGMLMLAHARYGIATTSSSQANVAEEMLRDIQSVVLLGRRMQGPNATVAATLNGIELRAGGLLALAWVVQHRRETIKAPAELAQFLAREQTLGRGALQRAWEHELRAAEIFLNDCFRQLQPQLAAPAARAQFRAELAAQNLLPKQKLKDAELLDFVSTRTLRKSFRRFQQGAADFARRPAAWRQAHRTEFAMQQAKLYRPWSQRLDPFPLPTVDALLFAEDRTEAQANLLICALAILGTAQDHQPLRPLADYLKAANIDAAFAVEPFTGVPYKLEPAKNGRLTLHGPDRRTLLFCGIPDFEIQRRWINHARPLALPLTPSGPAAAPTAIHTSARRARR